LAGNTDRKSDNWGTIDGELQNPALIDHGHAFSVGLTESPFATRFRGQPVPPEFAALARRLLDHRDESRLGHFLPSAERDRVFERAWELLQNKLLPV
jgi:hypothetical protein